MTSSDHKHDAGSLQREAIRLDRLEIIDPELSNRISCLLSEKNVPIPPDLVAMLEEETLWALLKDIELGYLTAEGFAHLLGEVSLERIETYRDTIRQAGEKGLNLARMLARYWVPVLRYGDDALVRRFADVVEVMRKKGEYTLKKPFDYLSLLLESGSHATAEGFLGLLIELFSGDLPYKECLAMARAVPETLAGLPASKRNRQISQLRRAAREDVRLVHPFMTALGENLYRLSEDGLRRFVTAGLAAWERSEDEGLGFLSLASKQGADAYNDLRVSVSLSEMRGYLNQYLAARTGMGISVRPLSAIGGSALAGLSAPPFVLSDGRRIYLADEIGMFPERQENREMYKCLVRLESACYEFGTFDFDLERTMEALGLPAPDADEPRRSDLERFFRTFPDPGLAGDLFTIFEQGRLRVILKSVYPGVVRGAFPFLVGAANQVAPEERGRDILIWLYRRIAMGELLEARLPGFGGALARIERRFESQIAPDSDVNAVGKLIFEAYPDVVCGIGADLPVTPLAPPFGRRFRPDLHFSTYLGADEAARRIQSLLKAKGVKVYRQDVRKRLILQQGTLSREDLESLVVSPSETGDDAAASGRSDDDSGAAAEVLAEVLGEQAADDRTAEDDADPVYWYREWDHQLGDYLPDHVRLSERSLGDAAGDFYENALRRRYGLVKTIRKAFELLRPEALTLLRRWTDGDDFDYRALIDFAVDRRAGIMPSDRLYTKRVKHQRDVAVLLLVDMSHSTSNRVFASEATVLDLEKEAIVLFAEALQVVGDNFAVAGFSGTGRLGADYYRIKDFDRPVDDGVRRRIGAMRPQRSTRMGAAIRHAAAELDTAAARVRLLVILGDGFPNDTGYKREYAIADTRKAIAEARSKSIHARAITVNIVGDASLDELYGSFHHNVISDVRELPDKLLRIYSALTR